MRETKLVVIEDGRDKGKRFVIKEMPAWKGEKWAYRLLLALAAAGADLGDLQGGGGMAALAAAGLQAMPMLNMRDAEPLLDEMMECVKINEDPKHPEIVRDLTVTVDGDNDDIQDVSTLLRLRTEILELHTRFFGKGAPSKGSTSETTTSQTSSPA